MTSGGGRIGEKSSSGVHPRDDQAARLLRPPPEREAGNSASLLHNPNIRSESESAMSFFSDPESGRLAGNRYLVRGRRTATEALRRIPETYSKLSRDTASKVVWGIDFANLDCNPAEHMNRKAA